MASSQGWRWVQDDRCDDGNSVRRAPTLKRLCMVYRESGGKPRSNNLRPAQSSDNVHCFLAHKGILLECERAAHYQYLPRQRSSRW